MSRISFGEFTEGRKFKVVDERAMRASSGIMLALAMIAFLNGFLLQKFHVIPYIAGFLMVNFIIGIVINPKYSPTVFIGTLIVRKQSPLPIGAIQKKFAWSLGLVLSSIIFGLSFMLQQDISYFNAVCLLCLVCVALLFIETAFGICLGCQLYFMALGLKLMPTPKEAEQPNCMGDSCEGNS
jgi:hypothetical protein